MSQLPAAESKRPKELELQVVQNQALWSLGHVITSGAFLHYFFYDLEVDFAVITVVMALPELVGALAVFTRVLLQCEIGLKKIWSRLLIASRLTALGIPFCLILGKPPEDADPIALLLLTIFGISEILQAFSYTAYVSWLSALSPRTRWGELFAYRNIAKVAVLLVWASSIGLVRDYLKDELSAQHMTYFYVSCFIVGCLLQIASWWPLRTQPEPDVLPEVKRFDWGEVLVSIVQNRSLRWLLMHSWTLAFFNGLTQSVFFLYCVKLLETDLLIYTLLAGLMQFVKLPVSYFAGQACDRGYDKLMLWGGLLIANGGLLFAFPATADTVWWLAGCYFLWGFYAAANIGGRNLLLKHAPQEDNTLQLALFRRVSGAMAGLSGLLGGYLLSAYFEIGSLTLWEFQLEIFGLQLQLGGDPDAAGKYLAIMALSVLGRYFSLLFLLRVEPHPDQPSIPAE